MSSKLPKQSDIDAQLLPALNTNPLNLFLKLGCLATVLLVVTTWLGIVAVMSTELMDWQLWPYIAIPLILWIIFFALPALFISRKAAFAILNAIAETAEAWLARAGYSIDLNNDGYIGHIQPTVIQPIQTQVNQPMLVRSAQGTKLLNHEATTVLPANETTTPTHTVEQSSTVTPIVRRMWKLPNDVQCPQETVEEFIERIFIRGWSRGDWVPKLLDRDTYDGLIMQLEQAGILEGRKVGYRGKLTIEGSHQAKQALGLLPSGSVSTSILNPVPEPDTSLVGRYKHI